MSRHIFAQSAHSSSAPTPEQVERVRTALRSAAGELLEPLPKRLRSASRWGSRHQLKAVPDALRPGSLHVMPAEARLDGVAVAWSVVWIASHAERVGGAGPAREMFMFEVRVGTEGTARRRASAIGPTLVSSAADLLAPVRGRSPTAPRRRPGGAEARLTTKWRTRSGRTVRRAPGAQAPACPASLEMAMGALRHPAGSWRSHRRCDPHRCLGNLPVAAARDVARGPGQPAEAPPRCGRARPTCAERTV